MLLFRLIACIPRLFLPLIGISFGLLTHILARKQVRIAQNNIEKVYNLPRNSQFSRDFVREFFITQVMLGMETIRYIFRPDQVVIEGLEEAARVLEPASAQTGVVIIAAHHGAWELAGHCAAKILNRDFFALAKPSRSVWFTKVLNEFRRRLGMNVLWTDSKTLLRDMMTVANRCDHLGFVMDQRPAKKLSGHACKFLGVESTQIVQGPAMMAAKKNMPVYGIHAVRTGLCRYHFFATEVLPVGHGVTDESSITQLMADDLSRMISRYPEQWAWNYRRWK